MFTIQYSYKNFVGNKVSFHTREEANECWVALKAMPGVSAMQALTDEKPAPKRYNVCRVQFVPNGKPYTYLSKDRVNIGSTVVVWTSEGRQLVEVVDSGEMSEPELLKICPKDRFKYIAGVVIPA